MRSIMIETKLSAEEFNEQNSLSEELGALGDAIAKATIGHDDEHLTGSFSRRGSLNDQSNMALIFKEQGQAGIGPDIMIQKESIELMDGEQILKRYVLTWPKDFPREERDQYLLIINPAAKKDKRRAIRGDNLHHYSKDMDVAWELVREAKELLKKFDGEA